VDPATLKDSSEVAAELERVARQFGITGAEDPTAFPNIKIVEPTLEPINITN